MAAVSIIIPTAGFSSRRTSLVRAIDAVIGQEQVDAEPIVVLNGSRCDQDLFDELQRRNDIRLFRLERPGLPGAINFGRRQVQTPFFGFLDDDDLYRPWAIRERLDALRRSPTADVVVSWGEREGVPAAGKRVPDADVWNPDDPLDALLGGCWLASCSGLFRTSTVTAEFFDPELKHLEWTSVAIRLALSRSVQFLESERPHFLIADSPGSLSKSSSYLLGMEDALDRLLSLPLPPKMRRGLRRKTIAVRHSMAEHFRNEGDLANAWRHHIRTFSCPDGFRYLPSTAHFLRSTIDRWFSRPS